MSVAWPCNGCHTLAGEPLVSKPFRGRSSMESLPGLAGGGLWINRQRPPASKPARRRGGCAPYFGSTPGWIFSTLGADFGWRNSGERGTHAGAVMAGALSCKVSFCWFLIFSMLGGRRQGRERTFREWARRRVVDSLHLVHSRNVSSYTEFKMRTGVFRHQGRDRSEAKGG